MWSLWADEIWLGKSGWVGEMMASTYKGKNKNQRPQALLGGLILTASSRNNELTLDSLQSPTSYSSCPGSISLSGPGKWGGVSGCSGSGWTASEPLNAFQLLRFWANCFACPFLEGSLKKKKKRWPTELVGFNFLCLKMSWIVFMLVVSSVLWLPSHAYWERRGDTSRMFALHCSLTFAFQGWFKLLCHTSPVSVCSMLAARDSSERTRSLPSKGS